MLINQNQSRRRPLPKARSPAVAKSPSSKQWTLERARSTVVNFTSCNSLRAKILFSKLMVVERRLQMRAAAMRRAISLQLLTCTLSLIPLLTQTITLQPTIHVKVALHLLPRQPIHWNLYAAALSMRSYRRSMKMKSLSRTMTTRKLRAALLPTGQRVCSP